jgi:hypothetical protein
VTARLRRIWKPDTIVAADGEVIAYQTPGVLLIRQHPASQDLQGEFVAIQDPLGKTRLALAIDNVGRDEGILLRALEVSDISAPARIRDQLSSLSENSVALVKSVNGDLESS